MTKANHKIIHSFSGSYLEVQYIPNVKTNGKCFLLDCTMKRRVNTCGNVQLNIIHSSGYVHLFENNLLDRISSEWDHDSDTLDELKYKQHNKVDLGGRYNSNGNHRNALLDDNHMCCVNVKGN